MEPQIIASDSGRAQVVLSADAEPVFEMTSVSTLLTSARHYGDEYILRHRIRKVFGRVAVHAVMEVDPEEGFTQEVLVVQTGIDDIDARMAQEEVFYGMLDGDAPFIDALRVITVAFE